MNKGVIVVDAKGHLIGRMASYVAKQLQLGQKVVIVRCENTLISGKHYRNKLNYLDFLRKRMSTNPKKGRFIKEHRVGSCGGRFGGWFRI